MTDKTAQALANLVNQYEGAGNTLLGVDLTPGQDEWVVIVHVHGTDDVFRHWIGEDGSVRDDDGTTHEEN